MTREEIDRLYDEFDRRMNEVVHGDEPKVEDYINHPTHYTSGAIECIDAMESAFGKDELMHYCKIAAFKYLWRMERKGGIEDIEKAVWYLNKYISLFEEKQNDALR